MRRASVYSVRPSPTRRAGNTRRLIRSGSSPSPRLWISTFRATRALPAALSWPAPSSFQPRRFGRSQASPCQQYGGVFRLQVARLNKPFLGFGEVAGMKRDIAQAEIRQDLFVAHARSPCGKSPWLPADRIHRSSPTRRKCIQTRSRARQELLSILQCSCLVRAKFSFSKDEISGSSARDGWLRRSPSRPERGISSPRYDCAI